MEGLIKIKCNALYKTIKVYIFVTYIIFVLIIRYVLIVRYKSEQFTEIISSITYYAGLQNVRTSQRYYFL